MKGRLWFEGDDGMAWKGDPLLFGEKRIYGCAGASVRKKSKKKGERVRRCLA